MYEKTYESTSPIITESLIGSKFFNPDYLFDHLIVPLRHLFTAEFLHILYTIISVFSIFFIAVIIYCTIRMFEIRKKEHAHLHHEIHEYAHRQAEREKKTLGIPASRNPRWQKVIEYLSSANENDWRLAIIESDLMLFDMLDQMGFKGETVGEKLKELTQDTFHNLSYAWEAHNIRNKIAHEGSSFFLSLREAKRIVALYERIFSEFAYI